MTHNIWIINRVEVNAPVFMNLQPDFSCSDTFNGTYDNKCYSNCTGKWLTVSPVPSYGALIARINSFSLFKIVFQSMFLKNRPLANQSSPNISSFVKKTILGRDNFDRIISIMTHNLWVIKIKFYVIIPQRSTYNSCWSFWNWYRQYCWWIFWRSIWKNQLDVYCFRLVFSNDYASQLLAQLPASSINWKL